ncbi:MAG: aminotransferase class V-fold PLP-dependent enzyme [Thermotogales bacterium]|nr:aminotransferase class V-fold PLP-dependent enzyme [Thermotogales bacterium]
MKLYLDYNASTPLDESVLAAMTDCMGGMPGNPSSTHQFGRALRARLDIAREQVAALAGVQPAQVIFTGGGSEANNLALHAVTAGQAAGRLAVSSIEHPSVLEPALALTSRGWQRDLIEVDEQCRVTTRALAGKLRRDTRLVSVMMANNETGVIQDIAGLAAQARSAGAIFHTDAIQAAGKIALDFESSGAQLLTLSAHKIYGPKGVGALIVDKSLELVPLVYGGGQEKGLRAGTENVAGIVGFGVAAELAKTQLEQRATRMRDLRARLEQGLAGYQEITVFAREVERLPNTVQLAVAGIDGEALLMQLDRAGIAVSSGSACGSGKNEASHVLLAMGVDTEIARGAIRISLGKDTTESEIDSLLTALDQQIKWVQKAGQAAGW